MNPKAKFIFIASMDVAPEKEALFNEVYETEHVPLLLKVPGVLAVSRSTTAPLEMVMGGERKAIVAEGEPRYSALYELESAEVLLSPEFFKNLFQIIKWRSYQKSLKNDYEPTLPIILKNNPK